METGPPAAGTLAAANALLAALWAEVVALRARVEELEARLARDSSNSSRPPSSDPPGTPPRPATSSSARSWPTSPTPAPPPSAANPAPRCSQLPLYHWRPERLPSASHLNRIECHFRPLREFVLNASDYTTHRDVAFAFRRYLRRRNTDHHNSRIRLLESRSRIA